MKRREFLSKAALATAAVASAAKRPAILKAQAKSTRRRKLKYVGWQVGVTYQTRTPGGLDRDYLMRLLDEMAEHKMNLLSLMMISYGYYDPDHDGYCWPVRNRELEHYRDSTSINGNPKTEFLRDIITAAAQRRIEVQLFMNWGIWNPEKITRGYPTAALQADRRGKSSGWLHCPDAPGAWQAGLDEVADLLTFYDHPNVTSYSLERISYLGGPNRCFCPHTQAQHRQLTGRDIVKAAPDQLESWKNKHIGAYLQQYVQHIKRIRANVSVWLHTQCAPGWGHDPASLKAAGIDYLLPHTIQFPETRESLYRKWRRLAPNRCVLHFCARDRRPTNYRLWIKTPEIITQAIDWVVECPGDNLAGLLFFNETAVSPTNKKTVYEQIKKFHWSQNFCP